MAVNNAIVYFPWGAGGNFIKNICTIDTRFEFFDEQPYKPAVDPSADERYYFLYHYYKRSITPSEWLKREWAIRLKYHGKYYDRGTIKYWDPEYNNIYECHGGIEEIERILDPSPLIHFDRTRVESGQLPEESSYWRLEDCKHIFLLPKNIQFITDIYHSKNPELNQLNPNASMDSRRKQAFIINRLMTLRLQELADTLTERGARVYKYTADNLYTNTGNQLIEAMMHEIGQRVPIEYIRPLHSNWLDGTKSVYRQFYNRELP